LREVAGPPRWQRRVTVAALCLTALLCALTAWFLRGEALYSLRRPLAIDLGELGAAELSGRLANQYVHAVAPLEVAPTVRFARLGEPDAAVISPVAGHPELWVEHHVPARFAGPRFVPPSRFAGRLVRVRDLGLGYLGVAAAIESARGAGAARDGWLLIDGIDPTGSRWAMALVLLMAGFSLWSVYGIVRLTRRIRPE